MKGQNIVPMSATRDDPDLLLYQLDLVLDQWRLAELPTRPSTGWVSAIRSALGMSRSYLGTRLGTTEGAVRKLEDAENRSAITLATLQRVAEALDCDFKYAIVPRRQLRDVVEDRAREIAYSELQPTLWSTPKQTPVGHPVLDQQVELRAQMLMQRRAALWRKPKDI